jgi:uncharacterized protein (DUF58 family)
MVLGFLKRKRARADTTPGPPAHAARPRHQESRPSAVPPEVLRQVKLLELRTRGLVNSLFTGEYRSVFKGQGMEFAEVREYQAGDEVRSIDWNVTARMQRPYVKRYIEERELTVMLAVFTERIEHVVPPRKGRRHALRLIRDILAFEPAGKATDIAGATEYMSKMLAHKAIIFLVSDFLGTDFERPLKLLAQRHDVVAVSVDDPSERILPDIGLVRLVDPETGQSLDVDTSDPAVRAQFQNQVGGESDRRRHLLRRLAIDEIAVSTDHGIMEPLLRFFRSRETRLRK